MTVDTPGPASDKQLVWDTLRRMPHDASLQEIAILAALRRGEAATAAGRAVSPEEVKRRSASWATP